MAIYNEILSGRFNRSLQKIFAIKGSPPVRQIGGEIVPVHLLGSGVEHRQLEAWNRFWTAAAGIVGLPGNSPTFRMTNDFGSNVIAVIEKLVVGTVAATLIDVAMANNQPLVAGHVPNLGTILPGQAMDARFQNLPPGPGPTTQQSVITVSTSQNTNTAGQLVQKRQTQAGVDIDLILLEDHEITLLPDTLLNIFSEAAASTLFVSVIWRERLLEESERS